MFRKRNKYYTARDGNIRRRGSYSVGYSEALQRGLIPDNRTSRRKYGDLLDKVEPIEWHHGMGGKKVNFYRRKDLING